MPKKKDKDYNCSFCFKSHEEVDRLFVSFKENAAICSECILLCIRGIFKETSCRFENFEKIDITDKDK